MKRLPLIILLLLCGASACDNIADITQPSIPTPAPDPVMPPQPDPPAPEPLPGPPAPEPEPVPEPPNPEPDPVPKPPAPDSDPTPEPEPPAPDPEPLPKPAPDTAPEPPVPAEISPLDPVTLLAKWQPRFAELGFRLEVGPGEPLPTIADPEQHRWPIGLYAAGDDWPRLYYAVFAPAQGSEEAIATAVSLIESYHSQAQQIAASDMP